MYKKFNLFSFKDLFIINYYSDFYKLLLTLPFPILTFSIFYLDSPYFSKNYIDGRNIVNIISIIYFILFFIVSQPHLRKLMFTMVFLSYIGEIIFCELLGWYQYRTDSIPLYVPFGHAIVYSSGYVLSEINYFVKHEILIRKIFIVFFTSLFIFSFFVFDDLFTLISGALFFLLVRRKKWNNLYFFIAMCVICIEILGTYWQCWNWNLLISDLIPSANPPMGAVFFYAGGDVLLLKIVNKFSPNDDK